ncbi:MAG: hypothetical protein AB1695_13825 [Stygiobacter sp.]|jgi:hypothetical protein
MRDKYILETPDGEVLQRIESFSIGKPEILKLAIIFSATGMYSSTKVSFRITIFKLYFEISFGKHE